MKKFFERFVKEETGSELIQFAIVVAIVAALAIVAIGISETAGGKMEEAADLIDGIDIPNNAGNTTTPSGNTGTPGGADAGGGTGGAGTEGAQQ